MNKTLLFFLPLFFSIIAIFIIENHISDFFPKDNEQDVFYKPGYTAIAEIEILDSYINRVSTTEEYLFFRESIMEFSRKAVKNSEAVASGCDEAVAVRIRFFTQSISGNTEQLLSDEADEGLSKSALLKIKADSWKLRDILEHALNKKTEWILADEREEKSELKSSARWIYGSFFAFILFLTGLSLYFYRYYRKSKNSIPVVNMIPDNTASRNESEELTKKLNREQIVSRRKGDLLDAIPMGIFSSDFNGKLTYINRKMTEWFNIGAECAGDLVETALLKMGVKDLNNGKFVFEGSIYWVFVQEINKENFYFVRDITEQEELARKLLDSERLVSIGEMASRITHEIRNPLSTVKLNSEYLAENVGELDDSQISASIGLIVKEVVRLESITDKYMNMVRYRNNDESEMLTSLPVDLLQLISFHLSEFEKRTIDINVEKCEECTVLITLSSFKEIMLNLFKNAWEELSDGGTVLINGNIVGSRIIITVEDSGRGIPEEEREVVFKNFFTKKPGGTGIGLSHSRKLAVEAGGKLYAADSKIGGVSMVLELPLKNKN